MLIHSNYMLGGLRCTGVLVNGLKMVWAYRESTKPGVHSPSLFASDRFRRRLRNAPFYVVAQGRDAVSPQCDAEARWQAKAAALKDCRWCLGGLYFGSAFLRALRCMSWPKKKMNSKAPALGMARRWRSVGCDKEDRCSELGSGVDDHHVEGRGQGKFAVGLAVISLIENASGLGFDGTSKMEWSFSIYLNPSCRS